MNFARSIDVFLGVISYPPHLVCSSKVGGVAFADGVIDVYAPLGWICNLHCKCLGGTNMYPHPCLGFAIAILLQFGVWYMYM